jgi:hypothetical protein
MRWRALLAVSLLVGCDDLTARSFAGSVIQMTLTLSSPDPMPADRHLELWARDQYDDTIRIDGITNAHTGESHFGLHVVVAVDPNDPCMIVSDPKSPAYGELLVTPQAYPNTTTINGVAQTPDQQAQQVKNRIAQVTAMTVKCESCGQDFVGLQAASLLAMVAHTDKSNLAAMQATSAADRAAACNDYWSDPLAYTANPAQLTAPLHGALLGFINYNTVAPPAGFDGLRVDTPVNLRGVQELWLTTESVPPAQVDPAHRGPLFLEGVPGSGGRDVLHFGLAGPGGAGAAAMYVNLDQDPISF